jgi:predicted phosphohydrolase
MLTFQIASDLHIECNTENYLDPLSFITPSADILILAGDIGSFYKIEQLKEFLTKLCKYFQIVIYIPGNHEYYIQKDIKPCTMKFLLRSIKILEHFIKNLYVLNKSCIEINNICIVGCTLWSNPTIKIPKYIVRIKGMNTYIYKKKFYEELRYITDMIDFCKKLNKKLIVVTHHMPTYSIFDTPNINKRGKYLSLYASNLDHLLVKDNIDTWISGHIHLNFDIITDGGTHLVGNQLGKPRDNIQDYNMRKIITIF